MKQTVLLPGAIILAGLIVAISVYMVRINNLPIEEGNVAALRPVSTEDHMIGNPTASVIIVEYSDIDCAYCKQFQRTMTQIMTEYAAGGEVAWVYRHFPLVNIHPNAGEHAEAAECVASLGQADAFWRFIDLIHSTSPNETQFNPEAYPALLPPLGILKSDFETCMDQNRFVKRVQADLENALEIGATATPYSIILIKGSDPVTVSGGLPYNAMKKVIETALTQVK